MTIGELRERKRRYEALIRAHVEIVEMLTEAVELTDRCILMIEDRSVDEILWPYRNTN